MPIPSDYKAPIKMSAKDKAYTQIQEWIIDGTLLPGEKILDTELSRALEISRTPIREALQLLGTQGFVEMKPGKETIVTRVKTDDLKDILTPLAALQSLAAGLATGYIDEKLLNELRITNHDFAAHVNNKDFYGALKLDEMFHMRIVQAAKNKYIWDMITMLQAHVRRYFFQKSLPLSKQSVIEHTKIIEALEGGHMPDAERYMKQNWLRPIDKMQL
ncbi:GntR family transcriptional regulator [Christensenellaceae bacterium OttesenSCG-928-K19]|nr:GntR family transcriptional regulator [Christensenellaceae bacterium OttesenSCG-928-K19]